MERSGTRGTPRMQTFVLLSVLVWLGTLGAGSWPLRRRGVVGSSASV
jgi:hypothetical protein